MSANVIPSAACVAPAGAFKIGKKENYKVHALGRSTQTICRRWAFAYEKLSNLQISLCARLWICNKSMHFPSLQLLKWNTIQSLNILLTLFLERGEVREKERQRNINARQKHPLVGPPMQPARDQAHNPGMCPDWESNQWPLALWDDAQTTESHWWGHNSEFIRKKRKYFLPWLV